MGGTRSEPQVRSHAQKYFQRLRRAKEIELLADQIARENKRRASSATLVDDDRRIAVPSFVPTTSNGEPSVVVGAENLRVDDSSPIAHLLAVIDVAP